MANNKINETRYNLKPIEVNLLAALQQAQQAELGNLISYIAIERFNYKVTEFTQFRVEEGILHITEQEPQKEAPQEEVTTA